MIDKLHPEASLETRQNSFADVSNGMMPFLFGVSLLSPIVQETFEELCTGKAVACTRQLHRSQQRHRQQAGQREEDEKEETKRQKGRRTEEMRKEVKRMGGGEKNRV